MSDSEDPRALAKRLAEQAKKRALAKQLAEQAKHKAAASASPEPAAKPKVRLADRAPKAMSAQDALARALAAEASQPKVAEAPPAATPASHAAKKPAAKKPAASKPAAKKPAGPAPRPAAVDPATFLGKRLPGAAVADVQQVTNPSAFQAVWTAHRVRAATEGDLRLLATADVLVDAASRLAADGALFAARVTLDGEAHAAFVDAGGGVLLGVAGPADLYLAGL